MKRLKILFSMVFVIIFITCQTYADKKTAPLKKRILVVSSYHREYNWSQKTNQGLCNAFLKLGYFDNKEQVQEYTKNDYIETSKIIIKKLWMNTKKKNKKSEIEDVSLEIYKIGLNFKQDIILLGDDNAANYIGNKYKDTSTPVVFWGINGSPLKYGLVESIKKPGHNITGIYQPGFFGDGFQLLKNILPDLKTFAILSDESETGRSYFKEAEYLAAQKIIPLKLVEIFTTSNFELFKEKALELQNKVDVFCIAQFTSLKDKDGNYVRPEDVADWYVKNIKKPDVGPTEQYSEQGILCVADDSGYQQGYEAGLIANDILYNNADPAVYPIRIPKRGALIVNRKRAQILKITLTDKMGIEKYIDTISGYDVNKKLLH